MLEVKNLHVSINGNKILKGINLKINAGEVHAIMGPNGSGKSSLANALMGNPSYTITKGEVYLDGENMLEMEPDKRSLAGLFLAFQYPLPIPGVTVANFLRSAVKARRAKDDDMSDFRKTLKAEMAGLLIDHPFAARYLNDGFSGGEKKRIEILQLAMLRPKMALLDETDSGLDIDALKIVAQGINRFHSDNNGILLITHYQRMLNYVKPDFVHVMMNGKFVKKGGPNLAMELEEKGYEWVEQETAQKVEV